MSPHMASRWPGATVELLGDSPRAFAHIGLVNAANATAEAEHGGLGEAGGSLHPAGRRRQNSSARLNSSWARGPLRRRRW